MEQPPPPLGTVGIANVVGPRYAFIVAPLLLQVSAVFYALVAVIGIIQLTKRLDEGERLVLIALSVAVSAHAGVIVARTLALGTVPIAGLSDGLSLFGFFAALMALSIAWKSRIPQAAVFAGLLAAALVAVAAFVTAPESTPEKFRTVWLPIHIAFAFLGEAAFAVAGIVAVVYLVQENRLKAKKGFAPRRGTGLRKLPALAVLDQVTLRLFQIGFPLLGIGLASGAIYSKQSTGQYWNWNILNTTAVLVWLLYAVLLYFRMTIGWRGRKAALLTLMGVLTTLVTLFALSLSGWGPHGVPGQP